MIRMKAAFALRLINDFSGNEIREKAFQFTVQEKVIKPVVKEEGLYVFLEPMEPIVCIKIESPYYHTCQVTVDKKVLNPMEPVADVRLYEKAGKLGSRGALICTGVLSGAENHPTEVYAKKSAPLGLQVREYRSIEGEHWILCSGFTKEAVLGKTWLLDDAKSPVTVIFQQKRGINEYRAEILSGEPKKIKAGTPIYRIYRSVTDHAGAYGIPVESGEETQNLEVKTLHKHKKKNKQEGD